MAFIEFSRPSKGTDYMRILISNDDGYAAPGIKALAQAMKRFGEVTIVAPEFNQSGASNSLTLTRPLLVNKIEDGVFSVSGTPSDSVHMALTGLLDEKPDLVVSGINCGQNMGEDTLYSGTVAAAMEGYFMGIDSIAFSQTHRGWNHLDDAARVAQIIVERFLEKKNAAQPHLLNVNIPNLPFDQLEGIVTTRLGRRHHAESAINEMSPRGFPIWWIGAAGQAKDFAEGTDFWATGLNAVSVTPLQVDLTNYSAVGLVDQWMGYEL